MRKSDYAVGLIFIIIGGVFLLINFGYINITINIADHWPLALIIPGLLFELGYFVKREDPGLLVPGGILLTYGAIFYLNIFHGWNLMSQLWPLFPMGVAIGLFQLYLFDDRDKDLLIAVGIIAGFSLAALSFTVDFLDFGLVAGIVLVLLGAYMVFRRK